MWERVKASPDWRFLAIVIPLMALLQLVGPEMLRYDRAAVDGGQLWRLLSAHWVHVGWMHWMFNSLGLVICVSLTTPGWSIRRWALQTLIMGIGISILLVLYNPDLRDYAGHSGILYGLYILGGVSLFRADRLIAVLVIAAIAVKILMEQFQFYDFNTGSLIGARVIVDAHLYGVMMAIAIALVWTTVTMNQGPREQSN